jgi:hypothetical protein
MLMLNKVTLQVGKCLKGDSQFGDKPIEKRADQEEETKINK